MAYLRVCEIVVAVVVVNMEIDCSFVVHCLASCLGIDSFDWDDVVETVQSFVAAVAVEGVRNFVIDVAVDAETVRNDFAAFVLVVAIAAVTLEKNLDSDSIVVVVVGGGCVAEFEE